MQRSALQSVVVGVVVVLLATMAQGIILPVIPAVIFQKHLLVGVLNAHEHFLLYGMVMALWALGVFLGGPFLGRLSDLIGRSPALLVTTMMTTVGYALTAIAIWEKSLILFIFARIICGYFSATYDIVQAIAMDVSQREHKAFYLGRLSVATSVGFILGPMLMGLVMAEHLHMSNAFLETFALAAFLSLLSIGCIALIRSAQSSQQGVEYSGMRYWLNALTLFRWLWSNACVRNIGLGLLLLQTGWALFVLAMPVYLKQQYHFNESLVGVYFTIMGVSSFLGIILLSLLPVAIRHWRKGYIVSVLVLICALIGLLSSQLTWVLWGVTVLAGMSNLVAYSLGTALLSDRMMQSQQGAAMGFGGGLFGLAWLIAALFMILLYQQSVIWLIFLGVAVLILSMMVIYFNLFGKSARQSLVHCC